MQAPKQAAKRRTEPLKGVGGRAEPLQGQVAERRLQRPPERSQQPPQIAGVAPQWRGAPPVCEARGGAGGLAPQPGAQPRTPQLERRRRALARGDNQRDGHGCAKKRRGGFSRSRGGAALAASLLLPKRVAELAAAVGSGPVETKKHRLLHPERG